MLLYNKKLKQFHKKTILTYSPKIFNKINNLLGYCPVA